MFLSFVLGPFIINKLIKKQVGQFVRDDGPKSHLSKAGTPTMGGLLILFCVLVPSLLWARLDNIYVITVLFIGASFGVLGFLDDYLKISKKSSKGVSAFIKICWQLITCLIFCLILHFWGFDTTLSVPFFKNFLPEIDVFIFFLAFIVIMGTSNAVNLTDGLDGLAIGPIMISGITFMVLAYISGHINMSDYLHVFYIKGAGELAIVCGAIFGAGLGFLWYNTYPAQVFMGDVGSLSLGGILGAIAVITKNEILLLLIGGVFVAETLSVIIQVLYYKRTKKRIFLMAPLHHHFELKGWAEPKIIVRFWIVSIILALLALGSLKLR